MNTKTFAVLFVTLFLGCLCKLTWDYSKMGSEEAVEYLQASQVQGLTSPQARQLVEAKFVKWTEVFKQPRRRRGSIPHTMAYFAMPNEREVFGEFTRSKLPELTPGKTVKIELWRGRVTQVEFGGKIELGLDHPAVGRAGIEWKSKLYCGAIVVVGVIVVGLLLRGRKS